MPGTIQCYYGLDKTSTISYVIISLGGFSCFFKWTVRILVSFSSGN